MSYNIMKIMKDPNSSKTIHVLLTDGLSQIWGIKTLNEAVNIAAMLTENSDSGHVYEVRGAPCTNNKG